MEDKSVKKPWFEASVLRIAGFIGAVFVIGGGLIALVNWLSVMSPERTKFGLSVANVIVLIVFCLSLRKPKYLYFKVKNKSKISSIREFWDSLGLLSIFADTAIIEVGEEKVDAIALARKNEDRVNKLVDQYTSHIFWFAFLMFWLYVAFGIDNKYLLNELFLTNKYDVLHPILKITEDLLNFTNSIFIFLGFMVLYDKTLDKDNKKFRYEDPVYIFSAIIAIIYLVVAAYSYKEITPSAIPSSIMQLIIGSLNGLTMALLFGRYVSMEHSLQNIEKGKSSEYIRWGIIIILPIYALAQPLFGSFEINAFGPPMNFQNIVFFICLVGKIFFLYVTWLFIEKRWMHYWLHSILISHGVPKDFYDCFEMETNEEKELTDIE